MSVFGMSGPVSTAAKFLIQAGVYGDELIAALHEIEASVSCQPIADKTAERRRAKDRERKRIQRLSADIPQTSVESADSADTTAKEIPPTPPKENKNNITPLSPPSEKTRGSRLPKDWQPEPLTTDFLKKWPVTQEFCENQFAQFCDYWAAQPGAKGRKTDWQGTWRNWLRRGLERQRGSPQRKTAHQNTRDHLKEILADDEHAARETEDHSNPTSLLADSR